MDKNKEETEVCHTGRGKTQTRQDKQAKRLDAHAQWTMPSPGARPRKSLCFACEASRMEAELWIPRHQEDALSALKYHLARFRRSGFQHAYSDL